jgi:hypothetical protein
MPFVSLTHEEFKKGVAPPDFSMPPSSGYKKPEIDEFGGGLDNSASIFCPKDCCQRKMPLDLVGVDSTFDESSGIIAR